VVPPGTEAAFLAPLPIRALWGVGPKSEAALVKGGFRVVGDLASADPARLEQLFGSRGRELWEMANGRDGRDVVTEWERKSVSAETTFPRDLADGPELRSHLEEVARDVVRRLNKLGTQGRTVAIKLRYHNFRTITRQSSRPEATDDLGEILGTVNSLLDKVVTPEDRFRLLGIHVSKLEGGERLRGDQMVLWEG
jgi:DNA polymerase IV